MKAGFDKVLFKPVALTEIKAVLASVVPVGGACGPITTTGQEACESASRTTFADWRSAKIRKEPQIGTLTQAESEAAVCEGIIRFQEDYLGWGAERIRAHFINDLLVVRLKGALTVANGNWSSPWHRRRAGISSSRHGNNCWSWRARCWESMVHEVVGVKVLSMHHDIRHRDRRRSGPLQLDRGAAVLLNGQSRQIAGQCLLHSRPGIYNYA